MITFYCIVNNIPLRPNYHGGDMGGGEGGYDLIYRGISEAVGSAILKNVNWHQ